MGDIHPTTPISNASSCPRKHIMAILIRCPSFFSLLLLCNCVSKLILMIIPLIGVSKLFLVADSLILVSKFLSPNTPT